jgi:large subunit ribosomal protein L30
MAEEKKVEQKPGEATPDKPKQAEPARSEEQSKSSQKAGPVRKEGQATESKKAEPEKQTKHAKSDGKLVVIRVRGEEGIRQDIRSTLEMLHLHRKHFCTVVKATASTLGMLRKAKDYVTWGEVDADTLRLLYDKRGVVYKGNPDNRRKYITAGQKRLKPFFRLHPPRGGFERKGIKKPFSTGGVLGDRKTAIKNLLTRMI